MILSPFSFSHLVDNFSFFFLFLFFLNGIFMISFDLYSRFSLTQSHNIAIISS